MSGESKARAAAARKAMETARKRDRRRKHLFTGGIVGFVVLVVVGVVLALTLHKSDSAAAAAAIPASPATTAQGRTDPPPWAVPADTAAQVKAAGLPMLGTEGTTEHIHAHVDVVVNGQPVVVPAGIGIDEATGELSPLHTHDTSGVIHVESPVQADFSLGQVFTEWQVSLSGDHIGGLKAGNGEELHAYVNGKPYQGDPAAILLHAHDEIALVYGTAAQQANPPASFTFPAGL
ncbi:hypothetical protein DFJ67_5459 [Asanoa ferruginea]|uniref:Uncharacterized protein n=1 Tax=Asanoa ferruginea TaxID=53367 RepID=A0A3D9ZTW5_9ACTN|nr:hypothetical protein [Asanoa ferruginea]REF99423.1 hypothetical protein DFJ67_5459 [Asanoa ferruginea]GIF46027.1 hypothetical protein Afe04nite_05660 [Asanoa ferruginea]